MYVFNLKNMFTHAPPSFSLPPRAPLQIVPERTTRPTDEVDKRIGKEEAFQ